MSKEQRKEQRQWRKETRAIDKQLKKDRKQDTNIDIDYSPAENIEYVDDINDTELFYTKDKSRKELVKLAETLAGAKTEKDIDLRNKIIAGNARPEDIKRRQGLFIRNFNKQLNKNLRHTAKMQEIENAKDGDVTALGRYQNYGKEDVARVLYPLLTIGPGIGTGVFGNTIKGGANMTKDIYNTLNFAFKNPALAKKAAVKTFLSTVGGEVAYQSSEWGKDKLNNSRFGNTMTNKYFAQPLLTSFGIIADPDAAATRVATKQGTKMLGHFISPDPNEIWKIGDNFAKANVDEMNSMFKQNLKKGGNRSKSLVESGIDSFSPHIADQQATALMTQARQKFGDDFLLEAIPPHLNYFTQFDDATRDAARKAFEQEMLTGEGLIANGTLSRLSGEELAQRGLAKQQGFGTNGIVLLRSAPQSEMLTVGKTIDSSAPIYSMLGDPGIVDKYVIAPRGTSMINLGINHNDYMEKVARIQNLQQQYLTMFNKALQEGSREKAIKGFRGYMWAQQAMPSTMQHYNVLASRNIIPDPKVKSQDVVDILNERARAVGQGITSQLDDAISVIDKRDVGSIISGEAPILTTGLTREYRDLPEILRIGNKWEITGKTHTVGSYPLIMSDATEVMYAPNMKQVTNQFAPLISDQLSGVQSHAANGIRNRIKMFPGEPRATPDNYVKAVSSTYGPQMTDALVYNSVDSTAGSGLLPSVSIINPFDGKFKTLSIPFRRNGQFRVVPGLKIGGNIPTYLKKFRHK